MIDHLSIGPVPAEEPCEQLGPDYSPSRARWECMTFIDLIKRTLGEPPAGTRLHVHSNPHDFGTYLEVCCTFDESVRDAVEYAYKVEAESPARWDSIARDRLRQTAREEG